MILTQQLIEMLEIVEDIAPELLQVREKTNFIYQVQWSNKDQHQGLNDSLDQIKPSIFFPLSSEQEYIDKDFDIQMIQIEIAQHPTIQNPYAKKIKEPMQKSPFSNAKQISIFSNHENWGSSIYFYEHDIEKIQKNFIYISTTVTETAEKQWEIKTYINCQQRVVFQINLEEKSTKITNSVWSYLSVYHHEAPKMQIYSLMYRWTELQIYSFWLVRAYAIETMLFRLEVEQIVPQKSLRNRMWHIEEYQQIKRMNENVIQEFARCGNWLTQKSIADYRLASHNIVMWQPCEINWCFHSHYYMQINDNYRTNYKEDELKQWFLIIQKLYTQYINYHRIRLWTTSGLRNQKVIFRGEKGTKLPFKGNVLDWMPHTKEEENTTEWQSMGVSYHNQDSEIDYIDAWIHSEEKERN